MSLSPSDRKCKRECHRGRLANDDALGNCCRSCDRRRGGGRRWKDASRRNPWCPVHFSVPLHSLMDMFGNDVNLHRVGIVNDAGDVTGIVTQSQVIRFLAEKVVSFSGVADKPISSWYTPSGKVVSVQLTDSTLKAFQTLLSNVRTPTHTVAAHSRSLTACLVHRVYTECLGCGGRGFHGFHRQHTERQRHQGLARQEHLCRPQPAAARVPCQVQRVL